MKGPILCHLYVYVYIYMHFHMYGYRNINAYVISIEQWWLQVFRHSTPWFLLSKQKCLISYIYIHSIYFISSSRPISTPSLILASLSLVMFTYICISISIYEYLCLCMYVCMNEYVNGTSRVHLLWFLGIV